MKVAVVLLGSPGLKSNNAETDSEIRFFAVIFLVYTVNLQNFMFVFIISWHALIKKKILNNTLDFGKTASHISFINI